MTCNAKLGQPLRVTNTGPRLLRLQVPRARGPLAGAARTVALAAPLRRSAACRLCEVLLMAEERTDAPFEERLRGELMESTRREYAVSPQNAADVRTLMAKLLGPVYPSDEETEAAWRRLYVALPPLDVAHGRKVTH